MSLFIKTFRFILLVSLAGSLTSAIFAQKKILKVSTCPEMTGQVLSRKVCETDLEWEKTDITTALMKSFSKTETPAGFSQLFKKSDEYIPTYDLTPNTLALNDVLTKIISVEPHYQWKEENGVVNVFPSDDYSIFSEIITEFKFENKTKDELLFEVLNTGAFKKYREKNELRSFPLVICCGLVGSQLPPRRFSINLKNATVREILNEIVRLNGSSTWIYREFESIFPRDELKRYYELYFLVDKS